MLNLDSESTLTPPPPSSSPCFVESMDVSPLPHKAAFVVESQIKPTPTETIIEDASLDMDMSQDTSVEPGQKSSVHE